MYKQKYGECCVGLKGDHHEKAYVWILYFYHLSSFFFLVFFFGAEGVEGPRGYLVLACARD